MKIGIIPQTRIKGHFLFTIAQPSEIAGDPSLTATQEYQLFNLSFSNSTAGCNEISITRVVWHIGMQ